VWRRDTLQEVEDRLTVQQMFARAALDARYERVLRLRYGFGDGPLTLKEVGEEIGVSRERIRQMEARALRRIRRRCKISDEKSDPGPRPANRWWRQIPQQLPQSPQRPPRPWFKRNPNQSEGEFLPGNVALTCDGCGEAFVSGIWHGGGQIAEKQIARLRELACTAGWQTEDGDRCLNCRNKERL
jgi:hypothetical protein